MAELHFLSTPISESRHGGNGTLQKLKWVVEFVDEKSKAIGIIISDLYIIAKVRYSTRKKSTIEIMSWKTSINRIFLNFRIFTLSPQGIP